VTSITTAATGPWPPSSDRLGRFARRYPDWWVWPVVAVAWWVIGALAVSSPSTHGAREAHFHHGWLTTQAGWLTMVVAMMGATTIPPLRRVAFDSLPRRRRRAMMVWSGGYLAVWIAFGVVATALAAMVGHSTWAFAGVLFVAAAYELTAHKRRSLRACLVTVPLPPTGRRADAACVRAGLRHGTVCIGSCWALMLAMALAGHGNLLFMLLLSSIAVAQRWLVVGTRLGPHAAVALLVAGALATAQ
jgi:predicted metal-binding membrane protein